MPAQAISKGREAILRDPTICFKLFSLSPAAGPSSGDARDLTGESGNNMTPGEASSLAGL
jgi:hypothetical protein